MSQVANIVITAMKLCPSSILDLHAINTRLTSDKVKVATARNVPLTVTSKILTCWTSDLTSQNTIYKAAS